MRETQLHIERLSQLGEGVASLDGRTVFVEGALPGEQVRARVRQEGHVLRGELLAVLQPSPDRRPPSFCPVADRCGGCGWMHLQEGAQRTAKVQIVLSALEHLGGLDVSALEVRSLLHGTRAMGYRRRAVLHAFPGGLGLYGRRSHDPVVLEACPALEPPLQQAPGVLGDRLRPILKDVDEVELLASGGEWAFAVHLRDRLKPRHRAAVEGAVRAGGAAGAVLVPREGPPVLLGQPTLRDELAPRLLRPDAFAQVQGEGNRMLVEAAVELLALTRQERVLELYAGNGNFTFSLAERAGSVVAVESGRAAFDLATRAAAEAKVQNVRFVLGSAEKVADGLAKGGERFDALLLDPPRTGARGVAGWAERLDVRRVVYVACDAAALARDARDLAGRGYRPGVLQLVDLFPQTHHIEAVMSFARSG